MKELEAVQVLWASSLFALLIPPTFTAGIIIKPQNHQK